ncbi:ATP-binding protein [Desulfosporosinus nitroreducens]|uniref:histidine kinase n=1 Tax=Desulfosporosinus nitroreducens TaxID=2018668 RepID=A0ABT8QLK9_9FIRM|nr:ATP-binding protein [Desulfosporosinus nitroreducens]MDO0822140.1 ATP-binding protein [Desulfosporosinus nitroreducens]
MGLIQSQPIYENEENAIDGIMSYDNYNQTRKFALILFSINFIFLFIDCNNRAKGLWAINEAYYYVFHTHVVLALVTLMFILVSYRVILHSANEITLFHKVFAILFAFFALNYSAIISGWISQEIDRPSNVYVIACFSVAVMVNFKSRVLAFLYGLSCLTFMISLTVSQEDPYMSFGYYMDVFLLVVISYFLSTVLYKFKQQNLRHKYYLEHLVMERTEELQATNNLLTKEIIERKRTEIEMVRLDRLNLIGEMAASISHEVRNPMTTVKGFLQLLLNKQDSKDKEYFNLMIEELDRANSILSEFLSISKNKPTMYEWYNINDVVTSTLPLVQADAQTNDKLLAIELNNVPDLQLDIQEIRQLILNLVRNGFEAMSSGGQLKIRTFCTKCEVVLVVADQGTGIEQSLLEKLGTPFFTTKEQGTGLGLAVCYGIVSRHNGRIIVETSPKGSTFNVNFDLGEQ